MYKPYFIALLCFACVLPKNFGQACMESSLDPNFNQKVFDQFIINFSSHKKGIKDQVPVTIHIAESIQGGSGLTSDIIKNTVQRVNGYFNESGIEFILCGAPRLVFGEQSYFRENADNLNRQNYVDETLNIYFVEEINDPNAGIGGFSFFPWTRQPQNRYVIMSWNFANIAGVLAHEIGHYYGLFHTHESANGLELVNGSNCRNAGDLLCDTPADYNLSVGGLDRCKYVGSFKDPSGADYDPDPKNIMSYAPSNCMSKLTFEQSAKINFYHTTNITYLTSECSFPDFLISSNEPPKSIRADEDIQVQYSLNLEGEIDLNEIEVYFWLSDEQSELGTIIQKETVQLPTGSTSVDLDFNIEFPINRSTNTYYLTAQVDPEFKVLEQEEGNNFHTISVTVDNSALDDQVVFANPVSNNILKIFLRDKSTKTPLSFYIWDHLGRLHKQVDAFKNREEYFEEIDVSSLADGLYILEAHFPDKSRSESFNFYKLSL